MNLLKRFQSLLKPHNNEGPSSAESKSPNDTPTPPPADTTLLTNENDDPYRNLSEINTREPVAKEQPTNDEYPRRGSLEWGLSSAPQTHDQADEDGYEALSEVAAPKPCSVSR